MENMVTFDFDIKTDDPDRLNKIIEKKYETDKKFEGVWGDLHAATNRSIWINDSYRDENIDNTNLLCNFLKPYVEGRIYITDEDHEHWCYEFDGKGNCKVLSSQIFYGFNSYNEFINEYAKGMPKDLKEDLENWYIANKV